jgi:hypothetical protein
MQFLMTPALERYVESVSETLPRYQVAVPGDKPVRLQNWQAVERYLYLLEHSDWQAYISAVVMEIT